jgi:hypothetical protein
MITFHADFLPKRYQFDITSPTGILPFPPKYAAGYLNRKEIQEELGVPLNFTGLSDGVYQGKMWRIYL